ncbi:MAG: hypothetical protein IJ575_11670 [Selenomonadaceae bacterium]|nr:hypothetical protein [Selenomonadaceae bacterium]
MIKKFLLTLFATSIFISTASAEVQTFDGVGEYIMSDFETPDVAKTHAKERAEKNALEQAGVFVESELNVENQTVTSEMIRTATLGIIKIENVSYELEPIENEGLLVRCTLAATIDPDHVEELISERQKEDRLKTVEPVAESNVPSDADQLFQDGQYRRAILLFTQAIAKDSSNEVLYVKRGICFAELEEYRRAISDFQRAQNLDPNNEWIDRAIRECERRDRMKNSRDDRFEDRDYREPSQPTRRVQPSQPSRPSRPSQTPQPRRYRY